MLPSWANQTLTRLRPAIIVQRGSEIPDWTSPDRLDISGCSVQPAGTSLSFVDLSHTEEYKGVAALQRVRLCDRVSVYCGPLGVSAVSMQVIRVVYNVLLERYDEMELGKARASYADTIMAGVSDAVSEFPTFAQVKSLMGTAVGDATDQITGARDSYVKFIYDANGGLQEIVVLDTDDISTAENVWRFNSGGIGHSSHGYGGPYTTAMTMDGQIVADVITAGTFNGNLIRAGKVLAEYLDGENLHVRAANIDGSLTIGQLSDDTQAALVSGSASKLQYYLSTSKSTATGGSWQDTTPAWSAGKYVWTRVATTVTKASGGTSTTYSTAVYDANLTSALESAAAANAAAADMATQVTRINSDIEDLQEQIDGNITTWFYDVDPTDSNEPAKNWTTTADKNLHLGDLYYNTASGYCWRWMVSGSTYAWQTVADTDVAKALEAAKNAQDTADSKRRVFFAQPTPPYDQGDLWTQGASGDILRCQTARSSGIYVASDWVLASKYTDDTAANAAQSTANGASKQEQLIYHAAAVGTTSMDAPTQWVTQNGDYQTVWTTRRPHHSITYPVLFVATQRQTMNGTVTCTTPVIDETTTVIDGGNIITGTVTANQLAAYAVTAAKLAADAVTADKIKAGEITIAKLADAAKGAIVSDTHTIYIAAAATTTSVSAPSYWVTETASDVYGKWTTSRPAYTTISPNCFVAIQSKLADGSVTCTTPVLDKTTTVIDGGNIITGTVTANQLAAYAVTAAKLAADAVTADKIKAGEITIAKLADAAKGAIVSDTHTIYIAAAATTTSVSAPSYWVTETASDVYGKWTTSRPAYTTISPNCFVAIQSKLADGSVTCTTPVLDKTTTVIDGGNILTGTVTADQIDATKLHVKAANIDDTLSASKIKGGTLTLGGSGNGNGQLIVNNASGKQVGKWDKDGIEIDSGKVDIRQSDGFGFSVGLYGDLAIGALVSNLSEINVDKFENNKCPFQVNNWGEVKASTIGFWGRPDDDSVFTKIGTFSGDHANQRINIDSDLHIMAAEELVQPPVDGGTALARPGRGAEDRPVGHRGGAQ